MKLGDKLTVITIYHKEVGGPEVDPKRPGVVQAEDGKMYVLDLLEPYVGPIEVRGES